jgi:hypothetical protein
MVETEISWSQYDQAYKRIHDKLLQILSADLTRVQEGKKVTRQEFTWNADGTISTIKFYDVNELLFTLAFNWNADGTLKEVARS